MDNSAREAMAAASSLRLESLDRIAPEQQLEQIGAER